MNTINILGVNVFAGSKAAALDMIEGFLRGEKGRYVVTPNPEIILKAAKDEEYFYILNKADLAIPDGIGLKFAAWVMGRNIERITGADLTRDILSLAGRKGIKVAIVIRRDSLSRPDDVKKKLASAYPDLRFVIEEADKEWDMPYYREINAFRPDILFVALGAPWQEKFIYRQLPKMPFVKLALGIGGAFDFLTGKIKRAPAPVRAIGMEWLWRIFQEPKGRRLWRLGRIYNAVIVFPLRFIKWRFINRFFYRKNVVGFLFDSSGQVLLVNWVHGEDYWGLPQGGVKGGEDDNGAIYREINEETGNTKFKIRGKFKNIYRYKWPKNYSHGGYKGQKQTLFILEFTGRDSDIKLCPWEHKAWKWVKADKLIDEAHPVHNTAYKLFLEKFKETITR